MARKRSAPRGHRPPRPAGREPPAASGPFADRRQRQGHEAQQVARAERRFDLVDVLGADLELVGEQRAHPDRHVRHHLEPHHRGEAPFTQLELHRLEQIVGELLVAGDVGGARDAEGVGLDQLLAREEAFEVLGDHLPERHEPVGVGQRQPARQRGRDLDPREAHFGAARMAHRDRQREREVRDERKGVRSVEPERGEDRKDARGEQPADMGALDLGEVVHLHQLDAVPGELRQHLPAQDFTLPGIEPAHLGADRRQLLGGCAAVGRDPGHAARELELQAAHPLHEELVEIAAEDRDELQPVERRHRRVLRLGEDPLVELQPGELAVEEGRAAGVFVAGSRGVRRHGLGEVRFGRAAHGASLPAARDGPVTPAGRRAIAARRPSRRRTATVASLRSLRRPAAATPGGRA